MPRPPIDDQPTSRAILCQQNGELAEFADLLTELAVPIQQHAGALPSPEDVQGASLAIVHGRRLLDGRAPNLSLWPRTIAVIDSSSKTLAARINRTGVAMVIHRPIHPRALRLLLLHEIYRGPERRGKKRILIGHPIHVRTGLFKHEATLLELSHTGARIEIAKTPRTGIGIRLILGRDLTLGKPLKIEGRVVRSIRPSGTPGHSAGEIGIAFADPRQNQKAVEQILKRFAMGPACWEGALAPRDAGRSKHADAPVPPTEAPPAAVADPLITTPNPGETQRLPPRHVSHEPVAPSAATSLPEPVAETEEDPERRHDPRIPYSRRIVALGEEAARVVVGCDLSQGGMRIAADEAVAVGDVLRVALHCGNEMEPLVVVADVQRSDGDAGLVLTFRELSPTARDHLEKIIASSSSIQAADPDSTFGSGSSGVVLGEMLETMARGGADETGGSVVDAGEAVEDIR